MTRCVCRQDRPCFHRPAPRRVVLLDGGDHGDTERVLAEPPAEDAVAELRRQAGVNQGRRVALEWLRGADWVRWLWAGERKAT